MQNHFNLPFEHTVHKYIFLTCLSLYTSVDYAAAVAHQAAFFNMGQVCNAGSRTFVQADIYDAFVKKSVELAKKRVIGDPFDDKTENGPQVKCLYNRRICFPKYENLLWL